MDHCFLRFGGIYYLPSYIFGWRGSNSLRHHFVAKCHSLWLGLILIFSHLVGLFFLDQVLMLGLFGEVEGFGCFKSALCVLFLLVYGFKEPVSIDFEL